MNFENIKLSRQVFFHGHIHVKSYYEYYFHGRYISECFTTYNAATSVLGHEPAHTVAYCILIKSINFKGMAP